MWACEYGNGLIPCWFSWCMKLKIEKVGSGKMRVMGSTVPKEKG